jgi:hypothetical protein
LLSSGEEEAAHVTSAKSQQSHRRLFSCGSALSKFTRFTFLEPVIPSQIPPLDTAKSVEPDRPAAVNSNTRNNKGRRKMNDRQDLALVAMPFDDRRKAQV